MQLRVRLSPSDVARAQADAAAILHLYYLTIERCRRFEQTTRKPPLSMPLVIINQPSCRLVLGQRERELNQQKQKLKNFFPPVISCAVS